jgi:glycerol uptake facilitator-like aquaporin
MDRPDLARRALTEALGTFVLVFAGSFRPVATSRERATTRP